jgi:hypothetical protein
MLGISRYSNRHQKTETFISTICIVLLNTLRHQVNKMQKNSSPESKVNSKNWSLLAEARMLFLKDAIEWLKSFVSERKTINITGTGNHFSQVEEKAIEIASLNLEKFQKQYAELWAEYGIEKPYEEYMRKYFESLHLKQEP